MGLTKISTHSRPSSGGIGLPTQEACAYSVQQLLDPQPSFDRELPPDFLGNEGGYGYFPRRNFTSRASETYLTATLRDIILQVKENADIVQVIGQYVPLKKAGSRYLGLCPFHHDRSPSMNVTPQMGIYKCFACGAGGDVLKFVQEYEKLDFLDALKIVAARAGVNIPEHIAFSKDDADKGKSSQALSANQVACQLYQEELAANPEVLKYLADRGVSEETRKHFQLGYAPPTSEKLLKRAAAKGLPGANRRRARVRPLRGPPDFPHLEHERPRDRFRRAHPRRRGRAERRASTQVCELSRVGLLPQEQGALRLELRAQPHGQGRRSRAGRRLHGSADAVAGRHQERRGRVGHSPDQRARSWTATSRAARPCAAAWSLCWPRASR
jgi:hypothetical protein